jgi:hypothetical protein
MKLHERFRVPYEVLMKHVGACETLMKYEGPYGACGTLMGP